MQYTWGIAVSNLHKNTSDSFFETCKILYNYKDQQGRPAVSWIWILRRLVMPNGGECKGNTPRKTNMDTQNSHIWKEIHCKAIIFGIYVRFRRGILQNAFNSALGIYGNLPIAIGT